MMESLIFLSHFVIMVIVCWFSIVESQESSTRLGSPNKGWWNHEKNHAVCLGNICQAPWRVCHEGLDGSVWDWKSGHLELQEHGNPIHQEQKIFQQHQVPYDPAKTSLQIKESFTTDLILGMDENNVADLKRMAPAEQNTRFIFLLPESVPDPSIPVILRRPIPESWLAVRLG